MPALQRFAKRLLSDYDAVRAAVTLAWSNGQVGLGLPRFCGHPEAFTRGVPDAQDASAVFV